MANTKQKTAEEVAATAKKTADTLTDFQKSVFTVDEFANMSDKFGTSSDIVRAALRLAGVKETSFFEAEKIIKKFKSKEV